MAAGDLSADGPLDAWRDPGTVHPTTTHEATTTMTHCRARSRMPTAYAELAGAGGVITVPVEPLIVTPPKLAVIVTPVMSLRFPSGCLGAGSLAVAGIEPWR